MANKDIFCNVPWTNLHIYWDGSFGGCCGETHAPHNEPNIYNINRITVAEWYNSAPMRNMRNRIKLDNRLSQCEGCYKEEAVGYESKRIRENFKTVIFTQRAFDKSYLQSPMYRDFETDSVNCLPVDWHVDLGNECNLACKMCNPRTSSKISSIFTKWNLINETANRNWTQDPISWQNFLDSIMSVPKLNRLHFMGGEPLLNKRFLELLDFLLENQRQDLSISFVTNGTIINTQVIDRLLKFRSCDIEVSLESTSDNNHYIRQASNTKDIINNIIWLHGRQTDRFHVILRSVPQLLNINNYDQYIAWSWQLGLPIQGIPLINPAYLQVSVLPLSLRKTFVQQYQTVKDSIPSTNIKELSTGRNAGALNTLLRRECDAMIAMLLAPEPDNVAELQTQLADWLMRWDKEFNLDARDYYPEYAEFLNDIQYRV
jgi:organic radical activating enzyme